MTDRINGLTVAFTHDFREDDCQCIIDAIMMIKGVAEVDLNVVDHSSYYARKQVKEELRSKISEWFNDL